MNYNKFNNEEKTKGNDYVTIPDAIKITNKDYHYIYRLYQRKSIRSKKSDDDKPLVCIADLKKYISSHPTINKDIVWDNIRPLKGEMFIPLTGYDFRYFVTNKGRLFNITTGDELINNPRKSDGYIQLLLKKDGEEYDEYLHRLIAAAFCHIREMEKYNSIAEFLEKTDFEVHHIYIGRKGKIKNTPECLLWTNPNIKYYEDDKEYTEHQMLHKLWNDNRKKEYWQMVRQIRKDNERELFKIPHPDYEPNKNFEFFMFIDKKGKQAYDKGKDIPLNCIFGESAEERNKSSVEEVI